jgi:hypothetical protein
MGVTAGIFLASILLKEMRYLVYIRYLWIQSVRKKLEKMVQKETLNMNPDIYGTHCD